MAGRGPHLTLPTCGLRTSTQRRPQPQTSLRQNLLFHSSAPSSTRFPCPTTPSKAQLLPCLRALELSRSRPHRTSSTTSRRRWPVLSRARTSRSRSWAIRDRRPGPPSAPPCGGKAVRSTPPPLLPPPPHAPGHPARDPPSSRSAPPPVPPGPVSSRPETGCGSSWGRCLLGPNTSARSLRLPSQRCTERSSSPSCLASSPGGRVRASRGCSLGPWW